MSMRRVILASGLVLGILVSGLGFGSVQAFKIGASLPQKFPVDVFDGAHQRDRDFGYFKNNLDLTGTKVFPEGISSTSHAQFINTITAHCRTGDTQHQVGAEFIILTMLGYNAGTPRTALGNCAASNAIYQKWVQTVQSYAVSNSGAPGTVDYSKVVFYECGELNTYYQNSQQDVGFFGANNNSGPECDLNREMIIFTNDNGTTYRIKKNCANPVGDLSPLDQDFNIQLTASGSPAVISVGGTGTISLSVRNLGPATSDPGVLQIMYPDTRVVPFCTPNCNDTNQSNLTAGGSTAKAFRTGSAIPGVAGTNWAWNVKALPKNGVTTGSLDFTISPTASTSTPLTFNLYYYAGNSAGAVRTATVTFTLVSVRTPGFAGLNGDIHAGSCTGAAGNGYVKGSASGASFGQYVVSGTSLVSGLTSGGQTAAGDKLKIGKTGSYKGVCQKDLVAIAVAGRSAGGYSTIGVTGAVTHIVLTGNEEGVYYFDGPELAIRGSVGNPVSPGVARKPVTIVATTGSITIEGNIVLNNATNAPRSVPSLGILSAGPVRINPVATRVDAYIFTNDIINTCNAPAANCSTAQLVVNGFLMGRDITFGRLGLANTSGRPISEAVVLTPQIYLNPPRFFDSTSDEVLLEGQGERAPLF